MRLLLDTCAFLWIAGDAPEISARARAAFADPENEVFLSSVSAWEIAVKHRIGRLPLPAPPETFVSENREAHGIDRLDLEEKAALRAGRLPDLHRDPFDRMLVAQAIEGVFVLLTPDEAIRQYAVKTLW